jgi:hypothetical protein
MEVENKLYTKLSSICETVACEKPGRAADVIVYRRISTNKIRSQSGNLGETNRFQIECYGTSLVKSRELAEEVKIALDLNTQDFHIAWLENDFYEKDIELNLYRTVLEFFITEYNN